VNVGRSTGVAEHHFRTVLTRFNVTRLVAVAGVGALGLVAAVPAHASTSTEQVAATAHAVDAAAQRWFTAQADAARINADIADVEHRIAIAQASMEHTRKLATERAVVIYKNSDIGLSSIFGDTALDSARRAHLADDANAGGDEAIAQLTIAVDDLNTQRSSLEDQRARQQKILTEVAAERAALDAELAAVRTEVRREATVALASARDRAARLRATAKVNSLSSVSPARTSNPLAAPIGPALSSAAPAIVAAPPADGRVSSHHNDPFLSCTRARESGGRYDIVSSSGYYGAYQFLPSTWDTTAVHAGRRDLVGVLPSHASQFDQDETAWSLYQWQGKSPWGGRC
jgi:hypothetical protein